jgi:DNA-binding NarL/FixJ family response regulator
MDIDLGPGLGGLDAAVEILKERDLPIIFLSSHLENHIIERVKGITPYGYVMKSTGTAILDKSIRTALALFETNKAADIDS